MGQVAMYALAVLLASLGLASAVAVLPQDHDGLHYVTLAQSIPDGKEYVYNYYGTVSAGQDEPRSVASKLSIRGNLVQQNFKNGSDSSASSFRFRHVSTAIYNGPNDAKLNVGKWDEQQHTLDKPFILVPSVKEHLEIKVREDDDNWYRNVKKAVASLVYLPMFSRKTLEKSSIMKHVVENTIHGLCEVRYHAYAKPGTGSQLFVLRKTFDPRSCAQYHRQIVVNNNQMKCGVEAEEDLVTEAEKIYEFEYVNDAEIRVKKIQSHEKSSYLPWSHRSFGIQYVETNQTIEFKEAVNEQSDISSSDKFVQIPLTSSLLFESRHYTEEINLEDVNYSSSKNQQDLENIKIELKKRLRTMTDYLIKNDLLEDNPVYDGMFTGLHSAMRKLDEESLQDIYESLELDKEDGKLARKIFLKLIPHLGTFSAWRFSLHNMKNEAKPGYKIEHGEAETLLANLPMFVLNPTPEFALNISRSFPGIDDTLFDAATLSYSILLDKTYKNVNFNKYSSKEEQNKRTLKFEVLYFERELENFYFQVQRQSTYQKKILNIMAIGNIQHRKSAELLMPLVRGEDVFEVQVDIDKPEKYRMAAMWAIFRSISHDNEMVYQTYWPIFSDTSLSQAMRLAAYEYLIPKNPNLSIELLTNVHSIMERENDKNIYNYHYTTLKSMAESSNPCQLQVSEMMRQILRLSEKPKLNGVLKSSSAMNYYYDPKYGHGLQTKIAFGIDETSGFPNIGQFEMVLSVSRRPKNEMGFYWNVDGLNLNSLYRIYKAAVPEHGGDKMDEVKIITDEKVKQILRQTMGYKKIDKNIHIEYRLINKGYVTGMQVFFEAGMAEKLKSFNKKYYIPNMMDLKEKDHKDKFNFDYLGIDFTNQYQMEVLTDLGIPAQYYNEAPDLTYLKFRPNLVPFRTVVMMKLELESKFYHVGRYGMRFFNLFGEKTQSVNRETVSQLTLPIDMTASFNFENSNFKVLLQREKDSKFSTAGLKITSKDYVNIEECVYSGKDFCGYDSSIGYSTYTANGADDENKTNYENVIQFNEAGLEMHHKISGCYPHRTFNDDIKEWIRMFKPVENSSNFNQIGIVLSQAIINFFEAPYLSSCKSVVKILPSNANPISNIEMNFRFQVRVLEEPSRANSQTKENKSSQGKPINFLVFSVQGSVDRKEKNSNDTKSHWGIDLQAKISDYDRRFELHLKKRAKDEKNLNICVRTTKTYPNLQNMAELIEPVTNATLLISYDNADVYECNREDSSAIIVQVKGELSDEQKDLMKKNVQSESSCFKNPSNPLVFNATKRFDWNCLDEAIKFTTLRKYTVNAKYHMIPNETLSRLEYFVNYLRYDVLPYITYKSDHTASPGSVKLTAQYSLNENHMSLEANNPYYTEVLENTMYGSDDSEDKLNDSILDNVLFDTHFLNLFYHGDIRPCFAHADELITDLNQTVKMNFNDWNLLYGEHQLMTFAVFGKTINNKVAMKMFFGSHVVTVLPDDGNNIYSITMDDKKVVINKEECGYKIVSPSWMMYQGDFQWKMINQLLKVSLNDYITIYYNSHNIVLILKPSSSFGVAYDGVCGHFGLPSYTQEVPLVYTE